MLAEIPVRSDGLMVAPDLPVTPAPWRIKGTGWVILYRFEGDSALEPGPRVEMPELRGTYRGGLGAIAWMHYTQTPVGPYDELLFVPGRFEVPHKHKTKRFFSISRIFVSTWESVVSGRANWGLPKDRADFVVDVRPNGEDYLKASVDGQTTCEMTVKPGLLRLPFFSNGWFPITMMQQWEGQQFLIPLRMRSAVEWLNVLSMSADEALFPDLSGKRALGAVKLDRFDITFPIPKMGTGTPHQAHYES